MPNVAEFPHRTPDDGKRLFTCNNCDCCSFKLMQYANRDDVVIRCANCEAPQAGFFVTLGDELK